MQSDTNWCSLHRARALSGLTQTGGDLDDCHADLKANLKISRDVFRRLSLVG